MKKTTDAHRRDASFAVGDWVYVKLCFYCQTFLSSTTYQKLGRVYYGPYQIKETIGSVAYKLALFDSAKIHLVFHCSLAETIPWSHTIRATPSLEDKPIIEPLVILDHGRNLRIHPSCVSLFNGWVCSRRTLLRKIGLSYKLLTTLRTRCFLKQ